MAQAVSQGEFYGVRENPPPTSHEHLATPQTQNLPAGEEFVPRGGAAKAKVAEPVEGGEGEDGVEPYQTDPFEEPLEEMYVYGHLDGIKWKDFIHQFNVYGDLPRLVVLDMPGEKVSQV